MYSIILTTYKNPKYLKLCVDSILNNSYYKTHQLCIHVNGYDQETIDYLTSKNIKYTITQDNVGIAKAGLICAKQAIYNTLLSANDDQYFCKNWDYYLHQWEIELSTKFPDYKQFISYRMCEPFAGSFLPICNAGIDIDTFNLDKLNEYIKEHSIHDIQGWLTNTTCPKDIFIKCTTDFKSKICDIDFIMNILKYLKDNNIKFLMVGVKDSCVYHFGSIVTKRMAKQNIIETDEVPKFENKWKMSIDSAFNKVLKNEIDRSIKLIKRQMTYVIGDSHIHLYENNDMFTIQTIGGATAHNLIKKDSTTKSNQKLFDIIKSINKERDSVILVLGEIDCRVHIYYQFKKNNEKYSISELIDRTINNYGQAMKILHDDGVKFYIQGVPPAGYQTNVYNYKWYATPEIHSRIYKEFNEKLKAFCNQHNYRYIDVYSKTVDKNGFMKKEYASDEWHVHLNKKILPDVVKMIKSYNTIANNTVPTISTYITAHNSLFYQSTLEQTIRQALKFSDEIIVVNSEQSSDGTKELLDQLHSEYPNIIKLYTFKEDYSKKWNTVTEKKTFALKHCTKDYCILQDDDECVHEKYVKYIKQLPIMCPETIAFRFNTLHFYRSYNHYQHCNESWYSKKIYMVKNMPEIKHGKVGTDLDNHIILNNNTGFFDSIDSLPSPKVINTPITSFHYGWARNDAILLLKKYSEDSLWHGNEHWIKKQFPFKFENPNALPEFKGTHPKYMIPLIEQENKMNSRHIKEFTL